MCTCMPPMYVATPELVCLWHRRRAVCNGVLCWRVPACFKKSNSKDRQYMTPPMVRPSTLMGAVLRVHSP
eukprot:365431-Chlamydomonas_euryale.AAC.27